jgi:TusA-related sulfurtransferase
LTYTRKRKKRFNKGVSLEIEIDGTKKNCAGVIAELEKNMREAKEDDTIIAIVKSIPDKIDIYAWAERKRHRIVDDFGTGPVYKIKIMK